MLHEPSYCSNLDSWRAGLLHRHCYFIDFDTWRAALLHRHDCFSKIGIWRAGFKFSQSVSEWLSQWVHQMSEVDVGK